MRKKLVTVVVAAFAAIAVVLATAGPAPAGDPPAVITVTKVVSGPEPAGATYVVTISCIGSGPFTGNNPNGALNYAAGGGTQDFMLVPSGYEGDCTFIESPPSGATVSYACAEADTGTSTCGGGGAAPSTLNVNDPPPGPLATITVTNTYATAATAVEAEPTTTG